MEQVAEALKQFKSSGLWDAGVIPVIADIVDKIEEETALSIDDEQVLAVFNAIINLYGKKAPIAKWHDRTDDSEFEPNEQYEWEHDITSEVYRESVTVEGVYPDHANKWMDGTFGGSCFESNGIEFKTTSAVRGIGYKALVAFDRKGRGIVFF